LYRTRYRTLQTKYDKMQITKEIYETLCQTSRFLKYNDEEKVWEEISPLAARDKVGHALRFANNYQAGGTKSKKKATTTTSSSTQRKRTVVRRQGSFSSSSTSTTTAAASLTTAASPTEVAAATITTNTSTTAPAHPPTKAELVASLVEVAKEEPKVWDHVVDHLTLAHNQETAAAAAAANGCGGAGAGSEMAPTGLEGNNYHQYPYIHQQHQNNHHHHHQRQLSCADPVALENIAYAMDTNTEDAALDELMHYLDNDATEEFIQDVLDQVAEGKGLGEQQPEQQQQQQSDEEEEEEELVDDPVPPSVTINVGPSSSLLPRPQGVTSSVSEESGTTIPIYDTTRGEDQQHDYYQQPKNPHRRTNSSLQQHQHHLQQRNKHQRIYSVDDDSWSVMKEPIFEFDNDDDDDDNNNDNDR